MEDGRKIIELKDLLKNLKLNDEDAELVISLTSELLHKPESPEE